MHSLIKIAVFVALLAVAVGGLWKLLRPKRLWVEGSNVKLITAEELALHNGTDPSLPLYLVVMGEVFDVSKGSRHYGVGSGYNIFCGRDGSRAFTTGEFTQTGAVASLAGLAPSQIKSVVGWRDFYRTHATYEFVGRLVGHFYDADGTPTQHLKDALAQVAEATSAEEYEDELRKTFSPCDVHAQSGHPIRYSCSVEGTTIRSITWKSRLTNQETSRCVCVEPEKEKSTSVVEKFPDVSFSAYENCGTGSIECFVKRTGHGL
eukprot:PhM_4_TR3458/c0_g1_i1/m.23133